MERRKFLFILPFIPSIIKWFYSTPPGNLNIIKSTPRKSNQDFNGLLKLNRTANFILNNCTGEQTVLDIIAKYQKTFQVNYTTAMNDCVNVIFFFMEIGLVKLT